MENVSNLPIDSVPRSLELMCIEFIAKNLDKFDSLQNYPVLLRQEIFLAAYRNNQFTIPSTAVFKRLELFSSVFITSLSLSSCPYLSNYLGNEFTLFAGVRSLDVGHCTLGDKHPLLCQLSYFTNLTQLSLRDTGLSHRGIYLMTYSLRVKGRGPDKLEALDLSENQDLDRRGINYLMVFPHLKCLDLSNTAITNRSRNLKKLLPKIYLSPPNEKEAGCAEFHILTRGMATNVIINGWFSWYNNKTKRSRNKPRVSYYKKRETSKKREKRGTSYLVLRR